MSRAAAMSRPLASLKGVGDRRAADLGVRRPADGRGSPRPLSPPLRRSRASASACRDRAGRIASAIGTIVSATIKRTRRPGFSVGLLPCRRFGLRRPADRRGFARPLSPRYEDRWYRVRSLIAGRIASAIGTITSATIKKTRRPGFSVFEGGAVGLPGRP